MIKPVRISSGVTKPSSALFVGNSFYYYNNGITTHLTQMLAASQPAHKWRSTLVGISGAGLDWHDVESYFRPNAIGSFAFDPANNIIFNKLERLFDLAILMDGSQGPIHPALAQSFRDFGKRHCDTIRRHGAAPVFFMTWAYADKPEMTRPLADAYTRAGSENDALVIPAGLAFACSIEQRRELDLYQPDKRHPSLAGTYLCTCLTYAALFEASPVGLTYTGGLDTETVQFLQSIARDALSDYVR